MIHSFTKEMLFARSHLNISVQRKSKTRKTLMLQGRVLLLTLESCLSTNIIYVLFYSSLWGLNSKHLYAWYKAVKSAHTHLAYKNCMENPIPSMKYCIMTDAITLHSRCCLYFQRKIISVSNCNMPGSFWQHQRVSISSHYSNKKKPHNFFYIAYYSQNMFGKYKFPIWFS